jgi:DNA-directed RNA polymerase omega subunit
LTETFEKGTFLLVNIAAQRARQLMQGATPMSKTDSRKPAAIAIREVEGGLIPFYTLDQLPNILEPSSEEEAAEPQEDEESE